MANPSTDQPSAAPFHLRTFGTLRLAHGEGDSLLGKHGQQKRRLALLAVLAAARSTGRSRDQLLLLFWPDATQTRARHSLEQLMYEIRSSIHENAFAGTNPVRLNEAVVTSDVASFKEAIERREFEAAAELYSGPFMDGFHYGDAPEFEQWQSAERAHLERAYADAVEHLASKAESSGDSAASAKWWRKLVDIDPLSSRYAAGYMRALLEGGDCPAALQYAEGYQRAVSRELGTGMGPELAALVAEARARSHAGTAATPRPVPAPAENSPITPAFAIAPELGIQPESPEASSPESRSQGRAQQRNRLRLYVGAAIILLAIALASGWGMRARASRSTPISTAPPSIAVLPFTNISGQGDDAPIVNGLNEEIIGLLAKVPGLRVISRTSVLGFRDAPLSARQIADSLGVANILEGSVQKSGPTIRVHVRLVDGGDGSTRWSETYNRDLSDIFRVQSDIAEAVAGELNLRLGSAVTANLRRAPTKSIAAHELVLRGNDPALLRSDSTAILGVEYFRQAVALDSTYAAAYAGLARMYLRLRNRGLVHPWGKKTYELAREAAMRAIALDETLPEAHASLGMLHMASGNLAAAEARMKRAAALDPGHSRIREWLSFVYQMQDRQVEALAESRRAVENDPLSPSAQAELARALCLNGRVAEGLDRLATLESLEPPLARVGVYRMLCLGKAGDWNSAAKAVSRGHVFGVALLGHAYGRIGQKDSAQAMLAELTAHWQRTEEGAFLVAMVYAGLGDHDRAFEWLNRSIDEASLIAQMMSPIFDDLKPDPRYRRFRARLDAGANKQ